MKAKLHTTGMLIGSREMGKLWKKLSRHPHLSAKTLDRLALLTGFQSWNDFMENFTGDTDDPLHSPDNEKEVTML